MKKEEFSLDLIIKALLKPAPNTYNRGLVSLYNSIFDEEYEYSKVNIYHANQEYINSHIKYNKKQPDYVTIIEDKITKKKNFIHMEFQTNYDKTMSIRMLEYGYMISKEYEQKDDEYDEILKFPRQKIIYINENKNIKDTHKIKFILDKQKEFVYEVDTIKIYEYDQDRMQKENLYLFIPLLMVDIINRLKKMNDEKLKENYEKIKEEIEKIAELTSDSLMDKKIEEEQAVSMNNAIITLTKYVEDKYYESSNLKEEVENKMEMLEVFKVDPRIIEARQAGMQDGIKVGRQEGMQEGAKGIVISLISNGVSEEFIIKNTNIDKKTLEEIKKQMKEQ